MKRLLFFSSFIILALYAAQPQPIAVTPIPGTPNGLRQTPLHSLVGGPHPTRNEPAQAQQEQQQQPPVLGTPIPGTPNGLRPTPVNPLAALRNQQAATRRAAAQAARPQQAPAFQVAQFQQQQPQNAPGQPQQALAQVGVPQQSAANPATINVINQTGQDITLRGLNAANQPINIQNLDGNTTATRAIIPQGVVNIFVQSTNNCTPIPIANGLKAITIANQNAGRYVIQPLIPQYENYIFIYNGSPNQQVAYVQLTIPRNTLFSSVFGGTENITISKTLDPLTTHLIEIPTLARLNANDGSNVTEITPQRIQLLTPGTNNITLRTINNPSAHNSFVITQANDLVPM